MSRLQIYVVTLLLTLAYALPGDKTEYHDVLKAGKKEWRLVFRGTSGSGQPLFPSYSKEMKDRAGDACKGVDFSAQCKSHYRNDDALDNWWMVKDVMFGIVKNGYIVRTLMFNGTGSDSLDWFTADRYKDSCYKDIKRRPGTTIFSMIGQPNKRRSFLIHLAGKPQSKSSDIDGWFVVHDLATTDSPNNKFPKFMYSGGPTITSLEEGNAQEADAIVIFVRYFQFDGQPSEYFDVLGSGQREWRLAFRATSNAGTPVKDAYDSGKGVPAVVDEACKSINWKANCNSHYYNRDALDSYNGENIDAILFGVVDDGALVKTITFDAVTSNKWDWFREDRVNDSCWSDLVTEEEKYYFRIQDDTKRSAAERHRTFFIASEYVPSDVPESRRLPLNKIIWLGAIDSTQPTSLEDWEKSDLSPSLLYSPGPRGIDVGAGQKMQNADAFVVFIKYKIFK